MEPQPHPACKGDYNHEGAHTLLPEGSGNELAKGGMWGEVEDRKGGTGKVPPLSHLGEKSQGLIFLSTWSWRRQIPEILNNNPEAPWFPSQLSKSLGNS